MKTIVLVSIVSILTGCASSPDVIIEAKKGSIIVPATENICIVFPGNGKFDGKEDKESGNKVGIIILESIPKKYKTSNVDSAKNCSENYLVTSEILEYEDSISGWSGNPDKIKVKVVLTNTKEGNSSSFTYYADSNMVVSVILEWGNAKPYQLLDRKFKDQVAALILGR